MNMFSKSIDRAIGLFTQQGSKKVESNKIVGTVN